MVLVPGTCAFHFADSLAYIVYMGQIHILKQKSLATQNLVGILFIIKITVLKMD